MEVPRAGLTEPGDQSAGPPELDHQEPTVMAELRLVLEPVIKALPRSPAVVQVALTASHAAR